MYVRDTWVGRHSVPASPDGPTMAPDITPMFSPDQWSAWRSVEDPSIPSTSGGSEAYNIQLRRYVGELSFNVNDFLSLRVCNGGVWSVIDAIRSEDCLTQKKISDLAADIPLTGHATYKRRAAARVEMLARVKQIATKGDGNHVDILKALVAAVEKTIATDV